MRIIQVKQITQKLQNLIQDCLVNIDGDFIELFKKSLEKETSPPCKWAGEKMLENAQLAPLDNSYVCQDTGLAVIFCDIGKSIGFDGDINTAIETAVKAAYKDARKSVCDPLSRQNTTTNTPPMIHYSFNDWDKLTIHFLAKGAGSENMSKLFMLNPTVGNKGIIDAVLSAIKSGAANACPPLIVGIGIGGTADKACYLSKRALLRKAGALNANENISALEKEILNSANTLGIGMGGFKGNIAVLSAAIETYPTHIGMLPVAVNLQCHSLRKGLIEL